MEQKTKKFDLIVIGSGIAGVHSALLASEHGMKVGLVEKHKLGGNSAHYSDVPFAVLSQTAQAIWQSKNLAEYGIKTSLTSYNFPTISKNINQAIEKSQVVNKKFYRDNGISLIEGNAYFLSPNKISVNKEHYQANKFIIASGATWSIPKIAGLSEIDFMTPNNIAGLSRLPKSIFIVGGHPEAVYLAQVLAILDVEVHLITKSLNLLPEFDKEFGQKIEKYLSSEFGIKISTSSRATEVVKNYDKLSISYIHAGINRQVTAEKLLLAESLLPQVDLGLNNAVVSYEEEGLVTTEFLQTSNKNIFGAGSVLGGLNQAQVAVLEAETAFYNLTNTKKRAIRYDHLPQIIPIIPKLTKVGLSEQDCLAQELECRVISVDFNNIPRSIINQKPAFGLIKIILNNKSQIIGATVLGPEVEGLIHQLALAVSHQFSLAELIEIPSTFLSWYEIINIAGNKG